jgi:putative DNA primase/helicase
MEILSAMGLSLRDIGPDGKKREWTLPASVAKIFKEAGPAIKKPLGPVEATYRYTDAHGELVAEKQRREGKVFLWRKPLIGGKWEWKVDRISLPLYRLHEVVKSSVVVLVEGEKDADNVAKLGICATTAPNGAKSWKPEYAPLFAGKKVWIIPDSDKPGMAYAGMAGKQISEHAQFVLIVSVYPAKDVSDYLLTHTPSELSALMKAKPLLRYTHAK